ncbi:MAG: tetratricopeptide repeat protein [Candidatus Aminicenantes bacterium]|nr:tetratricopeptide repeat protein [Candidatus Aminicenantes bacterium]
MSKGRIFISHSTKDNDFVTALGESIESRDFETWIDSRHMRPGDELETKIKQEIDTARAFIVVLSADALVSSWVKLETDYALQVRGQKEKPEDFPVIPLLLGLKKDVLKQYFKKELVGVKLALKGPGLITEAMPQILAALGERSPNGVQPMEKPQVKPLAELLLELSEPHIVTEEGKRRAGAGAKLSYIPAGEEKAVEEGSFRFTAPLGPIEAEDLRWYLEKYYLWPTGVFKERAAKVEKQLPEWGKMLFDAVFGDESVRNVFAAWEKAGSGIARRFTVFMNPAGQEKNVGTPDDSSSPESPSSAPRAAGPPARRRQETDENGQEADEAAALLLGLPWELLHDEVGYLFQGGQPVSVRRRLPFRRVYDAVVSEPPIRILLVSPRPEDERAGYIDHRASALPLVTAVENLGQLVKLNVLSPPTFPALEKELHRAQDAGAPYHVVHFDGHGVFRPDVGLGGLCFEKPGDQKKLEKRSSKIIDATELAAVIRGFRIPLFFLEACQSAKTEEDPTASVAAALLEQGVASVVAMSHSVLVETARRFVQAFYGKLAAGVRVGGAMLEGQRELKSDSFRLKIFGAGRLELQDWFVPVLYQEQEDLQLLTHVPSQDIREIDRETLERRFGALPPTPEHHFIGRSRELLTLERLLEQKPYAVVCGQGGEGKTTLAVELARWLIRTDRFDRAVFVSAEHVYDVRTVVDAIGRQLVPNYSVAEYGEGELLNKALHPIERELRNKSALIVLDNMESLLPNQKFSGGQGAFLKNRPLDPQKTSDESESKADITRFEPEELTTLFQLCQKLQKTGETRLLFTSREALPEPFDGKPHRVTLSRLTKDDAVELVHQAMTTAGLTPKEDDSGAAAPEVEALVEAVNRHARSLVLLAPYISRFGVRQAAENVGRLMAELHKAYPDERERSLFASVELSLGRLPQELRDKLPPLGLFQGGANAAILQVVLELSEEERDALLSKLVETGLAEAMPYGFFRFHPALCPYLRRELDEKQLPAATTRWVESMTQLAAFLYGQLSQDARIALNLTTLELPNLIRLLERVQVLGNAEATVDLTTSLETLIAQLGRKHLLARVVAIREEEAEKLPDWSHSRFASFGAQVDRLLDIGNFPGALQAAQALLDKCVHAGEEAYPGAAYDTAMAYNLHGQVLSGGGAAGSALQPLAEARSRFQALADQGSKSAARMVAVLLTRQGDCLLDLGRLQEAAAAYEKNIKLAEQLKDNRQAAVGKGQLATVRMLQGRYEEAIKAHDEAREIFENLGEPGMVAVAYHQTGRVHEEAGNYEAAEQAYRQSLAINVRQNNPPGEADTLNQLGLLYDKMERLEEAVTFLRQAADIYVEANNMADEGLARNNIAIRLIKLQRYDEARREILRAIECRKPYGHAATPWKTWEVLCNLEKAEGNSAAAEEARKQAVQLYLSYRRDGGENQSGSGRLCAAFRQALQENKTDEMEALLKELLNDPETHPSLKPLIPKLQAILKGSRDPALADDPALHYTDAVEIALLVEEEGAQES